MGLSLDPEQSCRCSLEQSGLWLCCWPQQCAFVGVTGPGRSNSPWAPDRREGPACMCISGPACPLPGGQGTAGGTWPCPPRMHYSEPSALSASSLGCLADFQPDWPCPGSCPCTGEVVDRCPGTQRCPGEFLRGPVLCPAPQSQPSHCFWTPYTQGNVAGSFLHPPAAPASAF